MLVAYASQTGFAEEIARRHGPRIELLEIGSSAGLNLMIDRYRFDLGGTMVGPADSPVAIVPEWKGPPPPDVPPLDEAAVGATASLRQQMEKHRADAMCASCHNKMDPLGFAFENYNAVGAFRTKDGEFPIDPSGQLPDGTTVTLCQPCHARETKALAGRRASARKTALQLSPSNKDLP